jgi:hypothetical protein
MKKKECAKIFDPKVMTGYSPQMLFRALYTGSKVGGFQLDMNTSRPATDTRGAGQLEKRGDSINVEFKDLFGEINERTKLEDVGFAMNTLVHELAHLADSVWGDKASPMENDWFGSSYNNEKLIGDCIK